MIIGLKKEIDSLYEYKKTKSIIHSAGCTRGIANGDI